MPPLGKSDHEVSDYDFHIVVMNEHVSAQPKPSVWKANTQDNIHPASAVDWLVEPESPVEVAWDVFGNLCLGVTEQWSDIVSYISP